MKTLGSYFEEVGELDRAGFLARFPHPVLLHRPEGMPEPPGFRTDLTDPGATRLEIATDLVTHPDLRVLPLEKREGTLFEHRICIGRTRNNDIVLPYAKISKFHAYFTWSETGDRYFITDPGSTNGTFVNGNRLTQLERIEVKDRTIVSFSRYHFRFHTPDGLFEALQSLMG
ncbi:MAG: FHA domain-containing protein [Deltaproteobacteria bacterium]|nr:FHA domain-containing protein [Deltaproteobacteria bacterium]